MAGKSPIADIVGRFGGQNALARALGRRQSVVWEWVNKGRIPYDRIPEVIEAGKQQVPPVVLEPNDFFAPDALSAHPGEAPA